MPKPVKITADTPCDIGAALVQRYNVELIPLHVTLGDTEYKDLIELIWIPFISTGTKLAHCQRQVPSA